jgi:hypothetical protein
MLLKSAYSRAELEQLVSQAPFSRYEIDTRGIGFELRAAA